jgi:hypothetical protein
MNSGGRSFVMLSIDRSIDSIKETISASDYSNAANIAYIILTITTLLYIIDYLHYLSRLGEEC